jgi:DNA segregation ATPase FtsK/SpoIIIE-like protein
LRRLLESQANQIELVLASHKISSRVLGGTVTPHTVRFQLATRMGTRLSSIKALSEEIALSVAAPSCHIVRHSGALHIEIPRAQPAQVSLLDLSRRLAFAPPCSPLLGPCPHLRHHRFWQDGTGSRNGPFPGPAQPAAPTPTAAH